MIVVIVTLGYLSQTVFSKTVQERNAVTAMKNRIREDLARQSVGADGKPLSPERRALAEAYAEGQVEQTGDNGDLLRFSFDAATLYTGPRVKGSNGALSDNGRKLIRGFGQFLLQYRRPGEPPGEGLFKRISVQGNCDPNESEGQKDDELWRISQDRAREVVLNLANDKEGAKDVEKLDMSVLEATGRGAWDTNRIPSPKRTTDETIPLRKHRVDIVIVFAGDKAAKYAKSAALKTTADQSSE
jgi:hypothetical protein